MPTRSPRDSRARPAAHHLRGAWEEFVAAHESAWKSPKQAALWRSQFRQYVAPKLGNRDVADISTRDVLAVLEPLWARIPNSAAILRGHMERVFDACRVKGYRDGENPCAWRDLRHLLPARAKVQGQASRRRAGRGGDRRLCQAQAGHRHASLVVRFCLLAAAVSEATGARWSEIDLDSATWVIPKERMKAGGEHRVPLSPEAVAILRQRKARHREGDLVFSGKRCARPVSLTALTTALRAASGDRSTTHGLRSSFDDWSQTRTTFAPRLIDLALAHRERNAVTAAYRRDDLLEPRRAVMNAWARFLRGK